ncbi:MAG: ZIP family metal transporter [Bacteroidetes bacterium]|nr:ZIP family metal transporter [Bacteroidota bacterium]
MFFTAAVILLSALVSGLLMLVFRVPRKPLRLLLGFSGAFLLALSLLHLIPELYHEGGSNTGIWILSGFLIQVLLEYITAGVEHGHDLTHSHSHSHDHPHAHDHSHDHSHVRHIVPAGVLIGLCLHAFLEGMPLGSEAVGEALFPPFVLGIVLHNIPIAIAFAGLMLHLGISRRRIVLNLLLFAAMTPAGMLASYFIGTQLTGGLTPYFHAITAVVVGIFLHISTTILFESSENHRFNAIKFFIILLGAAAAWLVTIAAAHG